MTSTTLMQTLLYKHVSLSPYKTAQGIQIAALPRMYPKLAIPLRVSLFRCPGEDDADASTSRDRRRAPDDDRRGRYDRDEYRRDDDDERRDRERD